MLPNLLRNALEETFLFREGMGSIKFTIADFIIRRVNGSEEEKIELLKQLHNRGISFKMYYTSYPEAVFYSTEGQPPSEAITYIEMLKKDGHYSKIVSYLETV